MFALRAPGSGRGAPVTWRAGGAFAWRDRLLRRPLRFFLHLASGNAEAPRFAATVATAALFGAAGLYGVLAGGHVDEVVRGVSSRGGFAVSDVHVTGNSETSEIDVLQTIGLDGWTSLVGFDVNEARSRIDELPWVERASVRKVYPSMVEVSIVERKPFAVWQHGDQLAIVERSGNVIMPFSGGRFAALPLIIGMGATEAGPAFIDRVKVIPELASRVKAYIRVGERRWDLLLENGVTVKLPEKDEGAALAALVDLDKRHGLLSRDIVAVDLRLKDRLIVKLTPEAAERHEAMVKDEIKNRRKLGMDI